MAQANDHMYAKQQLSIETHTNTQARKVGILAELRTCGVDFEISGIY